MSEAQQVTEQIGVGKPNPITEPPRTQLEGMAPQPQSKVEIPGSVLETKREQLRSAFARAQTLPDTFVAKDGKTKAQLLEALQGAMSGLREEIDRVQEISPNGHEETLTVGTPSETDSLPYIAIGTAKIPVCQPPKNPEQWRAVAGRLHVEGGKKWSEVSFEKRGHGEAPQSIKPGEEVMFGNRRGERLAIIDNILEGPKEVRAFNEVLSKLAQLQSQYQELNPDASDYDEQATTIAAQMSKIRSGAITDVIDISQFKVEDEDGFKVRMQEIVAIQDFLREIDPAKNEFIPEVDPSFKLTPYFEEKMAWFSQLVNRQIGLGNNRELDRLVESGQAPDWAKLKAKGMTVVVGPRGTGKNKLADHYAAISQRPMFRYACSPDKTEYDLTYDVILKDGEVVKIPSRIITGVTTPHALLELDEVNLLNPAVSKFFNSLLDHDRAIFLNNEVIEAAPGIVIVGLMNPADYEGVQNLPETIDDRSNAMQMGYPPFREKDPFTGNERFTYDEALILKNNIAPLTALSDEAFIKVWDQVINGTSGGGVVDPEVIKVVQDLKNLISIANKTRETVRNYKTGADRTTRMERDISLRGTIEAARFYSENHLWGKDLSTMPEYRKGWNAAAYAVAATYLPHTLTYKRGESDKQALETILAEQITR